MSAFEAASALVVRPVHRWWSPSLVDLFFVFLLLAAFAQPGGWQALLADGDTGWHIRTGELVLATGSAPRADPFSFTRPGEPWFAWEWLSDTAFAAAYHRGGLAAVARLCGTALCLAAALLFAWLLRRGSGLWIALGITLAAASASSVHYLARPHVFSILFYTASLWILDEVRRGRPALIWVLPPLCALWANLHAGFVALPATLVLAAATDAVRRDFPGARRQGAAALACLLASGLNPYGFRLHQHILAYLNAPWILDHVQEFQSPNIRSEGMLVFAALLLAGVALASRAMSRGAWFEGALVLGWSFAALRSARHVPFCAIAAAPVVASECALLWKRAAASAPARAPRRILWELGRDLGSRPRATFWLPLLGAAALAASPGQTTFPQTRFPVQAVERNTGSARAGLREAARPDVRPVVRLPHLPAVPGSAGLFRRSQRFLRPRSGRRLPHVDDSVGRMARDARALPLRPGAAAPRLALERDSRPGARLAQGLRRFRSEPLPMRRRRTAMTAHEYCALALGCAAVIDDLRRRRISNRITIAGLAAGLILGVIHAGWRGLGIAFAGAALGFGLFLLFYCLGGMGAGDLKLMAAFGALLGPAGILLAAVLGAAAGALLAAGAWLFKPRAAAIPYAPAIVAGAWLALFGRR